MASEISTADKVTFQKGKSNAALVRELHELNARVGQLETNLGDQLTSLREEVQEMIRRSKDQYLGARIVGLFLALLGAVLLALANLAPS